MTSGVGTRFLSERRPRAHDSQGRHADVLDAISLLVAYEGHASRDRQQLAGARSACRLEGRGCMPHRAGRGLARGARGSRRSERDVFCVRGGGLAWTERRESSTAECAARGTTRRGEPRGHRVQAAFNHCSFKWTRLAAVVDRLPRHGCNGDLQPRADEDVDRFAGVREFALVASVHHS